MLMDFHKTGQYEANQTPTGDCAYRSDLSEPMEGQSELAK
jgi:hypothetical protein